MLDFRVLPSARVPRSALPSSWLIPSCLQVVSAPVLYWKAGLHAVHDVNTSPFHHHCHPYLSFVCLRSISEIAIHKIMCSYIQPLSHTKVNSLLPSSFICAPSSSHLPTYLTQVVFVNVWTPHCQSLILGPKEKETRMRLGTNRKSGML